MPTVEAAPAAPATPAARRARHRGPRRGGHGAGRGGNAGANTVPESADASLATRPAQGAPEPALADPQRPSQRTGHRGGRGQGGFGRGGRRGGSQLMVNGQRAFGGQLTSTLPPPSEGSLAADAPEFIPGQPVIPRAQARPQNRNPPRRRMSKSQAPDIATRTHEDITNGQYECVICTNEVLPNSKIWNCKTCWSVLHLSCVKKWANNEVSTLHQRAVEAGELPPPRQWRCPGCNLPKTELPTRYTCWCEKEIDPKSIAGLPPHSCGQTCSKPRIGHCPHPCELICHAGPCPPCGHMGPSLACFCGKEESSRRCVDTKYDGGWSCGQICRDILPCGEHECQRECHEGLCGSCEVQVDSRCFCGRVQKSLPCSEREDEKESYLDGDSWVGSFNCGAECRRPYDCGKPDHFCERTCHAQTEKLAHCPFSPDVVTHCPCGKTSLSELLPEPRVDCTVPIPHCKERCHKLLTCGHPCEEICHNGECGPCFQKAQISCRCGRTTSDTMCHQGLEEPPSCGRICRSTLNCGRHECGERCCPGEKKASERQSAKKRHRPLNAGPRSDENIEPEHICLKVCGRFLKCGNHTCASLCHKGPCNSCLEAIFDEISCACGRTVLQPPQPCGTKRPPCNFDCTRQRTCGHPQIKHTCHPDTGPCPRCPFLVSKPCICGKKTLKNQPCWFTEVRCGQPCGKKLKCGIHFCQKLCHRSNQCEDITGCTQPCARKKTVCEHACSDPCHAPYPCKELMPCQAKIFITCPCQHQKQALKCLASKTSPGNQEKTLDCNDECLRLARNARLAAALNIDPATHLDDHIPYSNTTLSYFSANQSWSQIQEREFRVFAQDENEKRLRFKPMQAPQRAFIHALAEDFGLDSESMDQEPNRHVLVFKTPRFVSAPMKTLGQCVKIKALAAPSTVDISSVKEKVVRDPCNAFLLSGPRFGLTIEEVVTELKDAFKSKGAGIDIVFLDSGDVVAKVLMEGGWRVNLDHVLKDLKPVVMKKVASSGIAARTELCTVDGNGVVVSREGDGVRSGSGGWSQVAKGAAGGRKPTTEGVGKKSSFTVLGRRKEEKKKEKEKEKEKVVEAVDDWEKEVEGWGEEGIEMEVQGEGEAEEGTGEGEAVNAPVTAVA